MKKSLNVRCVVIPIYGTCRKRIPGSAGTVSTTGIVSRIASCPDLWGSEPSYPNTGIIHPWQDAIGAEQADSGTRMCPEKSLLKYYGKKRMAGRHSEKAGSLWGIIVRTHQDPANEDTSLSASILYPVTTRAMSTGPRINPTMPINGTPAKIPIIMTTG